MNISCNSDLSGEKFSGNEGIAFKTDIPVTQRHNDKCKVYDGGYISPGSADWETFCGSVPKTNACCLTVEGKTLCCLKRVKTGRPTGFVNDGGDFFQGSLDTILIPPGDTIITVQ